jgi:hypothetical protein
VIEAARLRPVLAELFETSSTRIIIPPALEGVRYDFALVLPRETTRNVLHDTMRAGVERHFSVRRKRRPVEVQMLTAPDGVRAFESLESFGRAGISGGSFDFFGSTLAAVVPEREGMMMASVMDLSIVPSGSRDIEDEIRSTKNRFLRMVGNDGVLGGIHQPLTMSELCVVLEGVLGRIFVDETGTTATYHIDMQAEVSDSEAFLRVLCNELGLVVTVAQQEIEMLVVGA